MRALLLVFALLLTSACSEGGSASPSGVVTYEPSGEGGDAALLNGFLAFDGGCFYVEADGKRVLPLFPEDEVTTEEGTLTYGERRYVDGDKIDLPGGTLSRISEVLAEATMPDDCDSRGRYWLVAQSH